MSTCLQKALKQSLQKALKQSLQKALDKAKPERAQAPLDGIFKQKK